MSVPVTPPERRSEIVCQIEWQGITIAVSYEADWLGMGAKGARHHTAHLQIEAISPPRAELPMTETGYRSHFTSPGVVEDAGGPETFVRAWLDHEAQSEDWKSRAAASRQLSLF